jgi:DNA primase
VSIGSYDTKEQIKRAVDIVDLVGEYIQLRREGRGYKGLCPWHDDSRPSLQVNPDRQSFKCWVCDVGGDIFAFLMKIEGIEFREALEMLSERTHIPLPARPGRPAEAPDEKQVLFAAMSWAEEQFHQCLLKSPEAEPARRYLAGRGITADSITRFRLGFAPDRWDWLLERSTGAPHKPAILQRVGLIAKGQDSGKLYDRFRGRVMFSIRDVQKRPVAFGGRVMPGSTEPAKYINSPETPLFSKSSLLYALDHAREAVSQSRTVIVMEGYTDVIVAHQHGFTNAVAVLGTALGERHIPLLRRFADRIVLMLDGDEAGQRRTNEVLNLFVQEQVDLQILTLPDELDPCDFLQQRGAEAFRQQLERTVDALDHKFGASTSGLDGNSTIHALQQATEEILDTLARAPRLRTTIGSAAKVKEDQILHRLSRRTGATEATLRARLAEKRRGIKPRSTRKPEAPQSAELPLDERTLLESLLLAPDQAGFVCNEIQDGQLQSARTQIIFSKCRQLCAAGIRPTFERLMLEFEDPQTQSVLVDLDERGRAKEGIDPLADLKALIAKFNEQKSKARLTAPAQQVLGEDEALKRMGALLELSVSRQKRPIEEREDTRQPGMNSLMEG